ncbi:MAG: M3 family oligoendopeptidase [Candidatus Thorarchaeota archaeon SMTZ1-45]
MTESMKMKWDLSQLVEFDDLGYIEEQLAASVKAAEEFSERHRGKIGTYNAKQLLDMLEESDRETLQYEGVFIYAFRMYDAEMNNDVAKRLADKARAASMLVQQAAAFIPLELGELLTKNPSIVDDPVLLEYKHFLEKIRRAVPYMLSEAEEKVIIAKDKNGIRAWSQLQGDWLATRAYELEIDGEIKTLPYGEIIQYYQHPDRELRRRVHEVVYHDLGNDNILWAAALRAICSDHLQMVKMRKWESPMTQSFLVNDVDEETINALFNTIKKNRGVYQDYLRLKARLLGFKKLGNWDIMAPLNDTPDKKYTWEESQNLVVKAYSEFDEEVGAWMQEMFQRRHIDAEVRNGKRSGAYCVTWHSGKSAYILQSFNGIMSDVFTQAHELGHAMHAYLGTRAQKPSNYDISYCVAETGSIFGELLITEKLLNQVKTKEERRSILATVCDEFGDTAFQVATRIWFESALYEAIEKGKYLDGDLISKLWVEARDMMYGDSVEWIDEMRWWWTFKLHFYMPSLRYYNYPYVYAQLFVYAMYRLYKEQGREFVPKLKALLAAGSSKSPRDLAAEIGFNITKEEFWQKGIDQFKEFIKQFEETL